MTSLSPRRLLRRWPRCLLIAVVCSSHVGAEVLDTFTEPIDKSDVATDDMGTVHEVYAKLGDHVAKGQMIAQLDVRALQAQLKLAQSRAESTARVEAAEAKRARAARHREKLLLISDRGHATSTEIENSETDIQLALTELELAQEETLQHQAEVDRIEAEIERRLTRSPFDGVVVSIHRRPGEFVSSASPIIATVVRLDQLRAKFYVSTSRAGRLKVGEPVKLVMDVRPVTGEVEYVAPITDPNGNTVRVDVVVDNRQFVLRSGTPCRLVLEPDSLPITPTLTRRDHLERSLLNRPVQSR